MSPHMLQHQASADTRRLLPRGRRQGLEAVARAKGTQAGQGSWPTLHTLGEGMTRWDQQRSVRREVAAYIPRKSAYNFI